MIGRMNASMALAAVLTLGSVPSLAQETGEMVNVAESEQFGQYLTDTDGRPLYMFTDDTPGANELACTGDCLERWPPYYTVGEPTAGPDLEETMVGERQLPDGQRVVTYNDWPLYYFANDEGADAPQGQGAGDKWYLLSPAGEQIESEG